VETSVLRGLSLSPYSDPFHRDQNACAARGMLGNLSDKVPTKENIFLVLTIVSICVTNSPDGFCVLLRGLNL